MIDQKVKIVFNREVARDIFFMGFRSVAMAAEARPGQFVMLRVGPDNDDSLPGFWL